MSLYSYDTTQAEEPDQYQRWRQLALLHPEKFVNEVEKNFKLDRDWKIYLRITREGSKADKSFEKKKYREGDIKPGDWLVAPYSGLRLKNILFAIRRGRLVRKT